jgi:hypothetical protein
VQTSGTEMSVAVTTCVESLSLNSELLQKVSNMPQQVKLATIVTDECFVTYTDICTEGFLAEHLSEEALEEICGANRMDMLKPEAHISVCPTCRVRALQARQFNQLVRRALRLV